MWVPMGSTPPSPAVLGRDAGLGLPPTVLLPQPLPAWLGQWGSGGPGGRTQRWACSLLLTGCSARSAAGLPAHSFGTPRTNLLEHPPGSTPSSEVRGQGPSSRGPCPELPGTNNPDRSGSPQIPVACVMCYRTQNSKCSLSRPGKHLVFPEVGPQGTDEKVSAPSPLLVALCPADELLFPSRARRGVRCPLHSLCDRRQSTSLSVSQFPPVQQEDNRRAALGGSFETDVRQEI